MPNDPVANDNDVTLPRGEAMRIFIFKSETRSDLRAFGDDLGGSGLPKQFRPWHAVGAIAPDRDPPHELSREVIEPPSRVTGFNFGA